MIEPLFEELARTKGAPRVAFVKVNPAAGMSSMAAREHGVAATPIFEFFLDGKRCVCGWLGSHLFAEQWVCVQTHELKSVNTPELRTQAGLRLYQAFPRRLILGCMRKDRRSLDD